MIRGFLLKSIYILVLFSLVLGLAGCGRGKKAAVIDPVNSLDEPDKVLYERAKRDLDRSRYNVARLTLQTLINTYPDSEFLPQAKYALAESFYKEGSTSALNQAEAEFKDYITFFPTSDLTDDAQLMVAMTHLRQIEKPDRDRTQALYAEAELKSMIETYPDSPLLDEAKQKLRAVQEVLAEGVYKIANFYYLRKSYPAATGRYKEVLIKYPDFSKAPEALFSLGESLRQSNNPESAIYYARVVTEHPLSERAGDAKQRLTEMKMPVPEPSPAALARAQQQAEHEDKGILGKMFGMFSRRPAVSTDTDAASVQDQPEDTNSNSNKSGGTFTIDPKVVPPAKPPVKKPQ